MKYFGRNVFSELDKRILYGQFYIIYLSNETGNSIFLKYNFQTGKKIYGYSPKCS